jgi:hypothetical protein
MSTNESLPPSFNAVKPKLIHLSPLIEFFYDPLQLGRNLVPKSVNSQNLLSWLLNRSLALTLDVVEQLFDWVQPWRVLRIQQDVHFEPTGSLVDLRMLVNAGVVHQYHDLLRLGFSVHAKLVQHTMQEVVEHNMVRPPFCDLGCDDTVSSDRRYHGQ